MEMRGYLRVIADRWIVIAMTALVGLLGAAAYVVLTPKVYTAQATLLVTPAFSKTAEAQSPTSEYSASQYVMQRISSYTHLGDSAQVLQPVVLQLGLNDTAAQLASKVSVTNPTATAVLFVSATAHNPAMTASIANTVATQLASAIESLEKGNPAAHSPVEVRVTRQASTPSAPSAPKRSLDLVFGLVLGLAFGLGLAVLRSRLDDTVKDSGDIREIAGAAPLALARGRRRTQSALSVQTLLQDAAAMESLRVGLTITNEGELPKIVAVTAPVSHEGKTAVAGSLAVAIARSGRSVCLVQSDLGGSDLALPLGMSHSAPGLTDFLAGRTEVDHVLYPWAETGLTVLPAGDVDESQPTMSPARIGSLFEELCKRYDVLVVETAPVLPVTDALAIPRFADATVVVTRYAKTKKDSLAECFNVLRLADTRHASTVLVGMSRRAWRKYSRHVADARDRLHRHSRARSAQHRQSQLGTDTPSGNVDAPGEPALLSPTRRVEPQLSHARPHPERSRSRAAEPLIHGKIGHAR
jgi:polysaccharide biosynthesis transport protein